MLKKLYKHEFYALFKGMLAVYIGLIGMALLSKLSFLISEEGILGTILQTSTTTIYILGVVAMFVVGLVIVIVRFYKNLLSKEGYLTFTLPFKAIQHLNCKLFCGITVIIVNFIVLLLSLLIFFIGGDGFNTFIDNLKMGFDMLTQVYRPWQIIIVGVELVMVIALSLFNTLLMPYCAMAIGQRFRSKIGGAVAAYLCLYAAHEFIDMIVVSVAALLGENVVNPLENHLFEAASIIIGAGVVYTGLITFALYFTTYRQLSRHLNLE